VPKLSPAKQQKPAQLLVTSNDTGHSAMSIAARVKQHQATARKMPTSTPKLSKAERVKARHHKQVHTVVDMETGELLEYHKLLRHSKFKDEWSISAANEFG
jgi:hypothetical protein